MEWIKIPNKKRHQQKKMEWYDNRAERCQARCEQNTMAPWDTSDLTELQFFDRWVIRICGFAMQGEIGDRSRVHGGRALNWTYFTTILEKQKTKNLQDIECHC